MSDRSSHPIEWVEYNNMWFKKFGHVWQMIHEKNLSCVRCGPKKSTQMEQFYTGSVKSDHGFGSKEHDKFVSCHRA